MVEIFNRKYPRNANHGLEVFSPDQIVRTLDEASLLLPEGVYTTFRTYNHHYGLQVEEHLNRLLDSAKRTGGNFEIQSEIIRSALQDFIRVIPFHESRIRITLDLTIDPGSIYICAEELKLLSDITYKTGVKVKTLALYRENPKAKQTSFITTAAKVRENLTGDINEILMVAKDGSILEGLSSNFFGVMDGCLYTADEEVLSGITRNLVISAARSSQIPVCFEKININRLNILEECFITSVSRSILPVVQIDEQVIGNGRPGPITQNLLKLYNDLIQKTITPI